MLQTIRDHLTGWIAGFILALLVVPFVFWGVDFDGGGANVVAAVNGDEIPVTELRRAYQNQLSFYQQFNPDGLSEAEQTRIRQQVVESFVRTEVLEQRADEAGYRIGDRELLAALQGIEAFQVDGRFSPESYQRLLALQGESQAGFEERLRRSLRVEQLQKAVSASAFLTPSEIRRRVELEAEQRNTGYLVLRAEQFTDAANVSEEEIAAAYEERKGDYALPEQADIEYVEISLAALADDVPVEEEALQAYYEAELEAGRFQVEEERRARHILVLPEEGESREDARGRAAQLTMQAREEGADFAALASEHSKDGATSPAGGDLGWALRSDLTGALSDAMFEMSAGEIRGPVESEFGFHVVKLEEVRGGERQSLEEVRAELGAELREREADSRFFDLGQQLDEAAFENPDSLEPVALELGLTVQRQAGVTRTSSTGVAAFPPVVNAVFSEAVLRGGENSKIIELEPGRAIVVRVAEHRPATIQPLDAVREPLTRDLRREKAALLAREQGLQAAARLKQGEDPAALATEIGAEWNPPRALTRNDQTAPRALVAAVFRAPRPSVGKPVIEGVELAGGDYAVFNVASIRMDPAVTASLNERGRQLLQTRGNQELSAYIAALREEADVFVNDQLLQ